MRVVDSVAANRVMNTVVGRLSVGQPARPEPGVAGKPGCRICAVHARSVSSTTPASYNGVPSMASVWGSRVGGLAKKPCEPNLVACSGDNTAQSPHRQRRHNQSDGVGEAEA